MTTTVASSAKPYPQIQGLMKKFGDNYAVDNIDLDIYQHEIFALLGSLDSSKSTLLRMLAGMESPNQDEVIFDGQDITELVPYERPINMMFQSYALFPHMNVEQNIAFGLKQDEMPKGEIDVRVEEALRLVQITKCVRYKPHQLPGGQQQCIILARSLVKRPKTLLLDEPLGALDKKLCQQTQLELINTLEQVDVICVIITHDQEEAVTMATRIAIMPDGQLRQVGAPNDVYDCPSNRFTAEFVGETNIFDGVVTDDHADFSIVKCNGLEDHVRIGHGLGVPNDHEAQIGIRPENIDLHREKPEHLDAYNWVQGTVKEVAYLGSFVIYHIKLANGHIVRSQIPAPYWYVCNITPSTWDEAVYISWPENQPTPLFS